mmetsp:Transcript_28885/g.79312  ORF Transcript_28885/g.79312 Transcript_28885/m.79312 type:complete len:256 (-) Transcript_28885:164-931(-)
MRSCSTSSKRVCSCARLEPTSSCCDIRSSTNCSKRNKRWWYRLRTSSLVTFATRTEDASSWLVCSICVNLARISSSSLWRHSHNLASIWSIRRICVWLSSESAFKLPLSSANRRSTLGWRSSIVPSFESKRVKAVSLERSLCCCTLAIWLLRRSSSTSICLRTTVKTSLSCACFTCRPTLSGDRGGVPVTELGPALDKFRRHVPWSLATASSGLLAATVVWPMRDAASSVASSLWSPSQRDIANLGQKGRRGWRG